MLIRRIHCLQALAVVAIALGIFAAFAPGLVRSVPPLDAEEQVAILVAQLLDPAREHRIQARSRLLEAMDAWRLLPVDDQAKRIDRLSQRLAQDIGRQFEPENQTPIPPIVQEVLIECMTWPNLGSRGDSIRACCAAIVENMRDKLPPR